MSAMDELASISHLLPLPVLKDINQRCGDWLSTGGKHDDPYIHQQLSFANNFIKAQEDK
ncbi:hypothetical protein LHA31_10220 [Carnobacterium viridans]|uniref:DUF6877 domain-containing protein n=1 Tax=Carnobacterium viridans TaxID=174587 RepID=A0A1H0YWM5_9LACT|nr:DUF6877 family protein [Carnobacterium viridans]UDE94920.1 hypothetical protein LHA31_10220 [Carnobacterium viridans]SDQ19266.1 hypothetical protein SAMN04487752_1182 [Carnobacterium viridans]